MVSTLPGVPPSGGTLARRALSPALGSRVLLKAQLRVDQSPSTPLLWTFAPPPSSLAASARLRLLEVLQNVQVWLFVCVSARDLLCFLNPHRHLLLFFPLGSDTLPASSSFLPLHPSGLAFRKCPSLRADGDGEHRGTVPQRAPPLGPPTAHGKPRHHQAQDGVGWRRQV